MMLAGDVSQLHVSKANTYLRMYCLYDLITVVVVVEIIMIFLWIPLSCYISQICIHVFIAYTVTLETIP